ncbi:N,N-dimethylformamidase beta subunit family domain-containing protein [Pantoea osteomyelitidis]|uniref:N,N-dimethylformamidase beta subunit family domain-containing protein n=1 Tax=Pantoea osteomyelitidis TaxID=3230026 RepID=A0ABW7PX53_9GAMM
MLIGYLSALSCRAGETVDIMISSTCPDVSIDLVRLIHGDNNPAGPGFLYEEIAQVATQSISAQEQETPIGSWAISQNKIALGKRLTIDFSLWPTLSVSDHIQAIFSLPDSALFVALTPEGKLAIYHEQRLIAVTSFALLNRHWYHVTVDISATGSQLRVCQAGKKAQHFTGEGSILKPESHVLMAAAQIDYRRGRRFPCHLYNGKIARPVLFVDGNEVARWAFEEEMHTQQVIDRHNHMPLSLINTPGRAMTGPAWNNQIHDWKQAPEQYDAIHFHEDDLSDACWPVSARITIPAELASGVYGVRLRAEGERPDYVPLTVRPASGAKHAKIALVLGTYTYVAYANEHLTEGDFEQGSEIPVQTGNWEDLVALHQEWGKSHYDLHNDGSGVACSSSLRPIPNMRPDYRFWGFHAPRRFPADLYMVWFLHQMGFHFDVITEHDLHQEHQTVLNPYQTIITGSHPEYYSGEMLNAYEEHVSHGGGLLYLGGDGFYWVTTPFNDLPHVLEVRKSEGLRHWDAEPGERYHASTGELGGIWRSRGRSAHGLFGVGMAGHGWDNKAPGYRRTERSYQPDAAWVFDGICDEVIGDFGLIMNGTSGDEIDRVDYRYGTPENTIILASSEPHSEWYVPVPEDVTTVSNTLNANYNREVRSDMVLVEHESGGAVFSVGSIIFTGALPVNNGENNVARLLGNIINNFNARK